MQKLVEKRKKEKTDLVEAYLMLEKDWTIRTCSDCDNFKDRMCTYWNVKKVVDLERICFVFVPSRRKSYEERGR